MASNITATLVRAETLNSNVSSLDNIVLGKYIKRSIAIVWSYIDIWQFYDEDTETYTYPDDMIQAVVFIIEYMYIDQGMVWSWPTSFESERIGDYSYTRKKQAISNNRIDLPVNILSILDKYRYFGGNIDVTVGWYDRTYIVEDDALDQSLFLG